MTLPAFLLARIADDKTVAFGLTPCPAVDCVHPPGCRSRVLAECEAKRRIVEQWEMTQPPASGADYAIEQELEMTLRHLAAVYADHPDYREEWKP